MMKGVKQDKGRQSSFLSICQCLIVFFSIDHNKNRRTSTQRVKRSLARLRPGLLVRVIGEFFLASELPSSEGKKTLNGSWLLLMWMINF